MPLWHRIRYGKKIESVEDPRYVRLVSVADWMVDVDTVEQH